MPSYARGGVYGFIIPAFHMVGKASERKMAYREIRVKAGKRRDSASHFSMVASKTLYFPNFPNIVYHCPLLLSIFLIRNSLEKAVSLQFPSLCP